jgi:branched-chain amino acid transport system ATP-binding protein
VTLSEKNAAVNPTAGVRIKIENLSLSFGGVKALTDIDIEVKDKEILAIIGPNGAGKTCKLNCISGF